MDLMNMVNDRLVEMIFAPTSETAVWLQTLGMEVISQEEGMFTIYNPGMNVRSIIDDDLDPINKAVAVSSILGGELWMQAFPGLLGMVNKERKLRSRASPLPPGKATSHRMTRQRQQPKATGQQVNFAELYKTIERGTK